MKLSTRSRYGTRFMIDLAHNSTDSPVQLNEIAKRQNISVKYLEQLVAPLKKANLIKSVRGPKGGHMLARPPDEITLGEIVDVLENGIALTQCAVKPEVCRRSRDCKARKIWEIATRTLSDKLNSIRLSEVDSLF